MQRYLSTLCVATLVSLAACSDTLEPGNASDQDKQEITAILDESGWFADVFGDDGAVGNFSLGTSFSFGFLRADAQVEVPLVRLWGRRHREPVSRERRVEIADNVADVVWVMTFDGAFLLDRTADDVRNPTSKPMQHQAVQHARFVRRETTDDQGRHWRLVGVSAREWRMTDPGKRTIDLARIEVFVNGVSQLVVEEPLRILDIDEGRIPQLEIGDVVRVVASVVNESELDNRPPEFVFLHLFHGNPNARGWIRVRMPPNDAGDYVREWTVRRAGRGRIIVDAIDSQAFATDEEDDYRANLVGIPYRIGRDADGTP